MTGNLFAAMNPKSHIKDLFSLPSLLNPSYYSEYIQRKPVRTLPPEIISDILSRLPVKTLSRFKFVAKSWHALIDSQFFIDNHLNKSKESNMLLIHANSKVRFVDYKTREIVSEIGDPSRANIFKYATISGSCNRLVCLSYKDYEELLTGIYLCNPSTRKYMKLPEPPCQFSDLPKTSPTWNLGLCHRWKFGLGYNLSSKDYEVVKFVSTCGDDTIWYSEILVYSLAAKMWKVIDCFLPNMYLWLSLGGGLFLNGVLHCMIYDDIVDSSAAIAFNLGSKGLQQFQLPKFDDKVISFMELAELDGCLGMCSIHSGNYEVWIMKDYGVNESWVKLYSFKGMIIANTIVMKKGDFVLLYDGQELRKYESENNHCTDLIVKGIPKYAYPIRDMSFYVESLVPLC